MNAYATIQVHGTTALDLHTKVKDEVSRLTAGIDPTKVTFNYNFVQGLDTNGALGTTLDTVSYVANVQVSYQVDA